MLMISAIAWYRPFQALVIDRFVANVFCMKSGIYTLFNLLFRAFRHFGLDDAKRLHLSELILVFAWSCDKHNIFKILVKTS